ncbi:hypothetical protein [Nocardioides maradonensis]
MALSDLLDALVHARRAEEALCRARPREAVSSALAEARFLTLEALIDYATAIEALSWPVPRGILLEIRMHRITCGRG